MSPNIDSILNNEETEAKIRLIGAHLLLNWDHSTMLTVCDDMVDEVNSIESRKRKRLLESAWDGIGS